MSTGTHKTYPRAQEPSSADSICPPFDVGSTTIGEYHEENSLCAPSRAADHQAMGATSNILKGGRHAKDPHSRCNCGLVDRYGHNRVSGRARSFGPYGIDIEPDHRSGVGSRCPDEG